MCPRNTARRWCSVAPPGARCCVIPSRPTSRPTTFSSAKWWAPGRTTACFRKRALEFDTAPDHLRAPAPRGGRQFYATGSPLCVKLINNWHLALIEQAPPAIFSIAQAPHPSTQLPVALLQPLTPHHHPCPAVFVRPVGLCSVGDVPRSLSNRTPARTGGGACTAWCGRWCSCSSCRPCCAVELAGRRAPQPRPSWASLCRPAAGGQLVLSYVWAW